MDLRLPGYPMNKLEETAKYWLDKGIATLPIGWKSKRPEVRSWAEYTERLPKVEEIERWYITPYHNIAVITGWRGLCILDFDDFARYYEWLDWAEDHSVKASIVKETTRICMSARGVHVYCYTREPSQNMKLEKLDVLCERKYALTAPSIHPSGVSYAVMMDREPVRIDSVTELIPPAWIEAAEAERRAVMEAEMMRSAESEIRNQKSEIDGSVVDRIKAAWRIEDFFPERIPSGRGWYSVRCPLHNDHRPSAGINTEQQIFTCFQHCYGYKPLDVIGLYARMHGIDNASAIREMSVRS